MRSKSFGNMQCPIARSLERVGEWATALECCRFRDRDTKKEPV
jgi:hypothetical protein